MQLNLELHVINQTNTCKDTAGRTAGYLSVQPMAQGVVLVLKGLACRARESLRRDRPVELTSPALRACGSADNFLAQYFYGCKNKWFYRAPSTLGLKERTYPHISIRSAGSTTQPIGSNTIKQPD